MEEKVNEKIFERASGGNACAAECWQDAGKRKSITNDFDSSTNQK